LCPTDRLVVYPAAALLNAMLGIACRTIHKVGLHDDMAIVLGSVPKVLGTLRRVVT
jgi:hypothetical protein